MSVSTEPAHSTIEAVLSRTFGASVRVRSSRRFVPWYAARCELESTSPDVPASVVLKWLRDNPNDVRTDPRQVVTEAAALAFAHDLRVGLAPRLVACAYQSRLLIMEDLTPRTPLRAVLLEDSGSVAARTGMTAFTHALADLAAASIGRAGCFHAKLHAMRPDGVPIEPRAADRALWSDEKWREARRHAEALGVNLAGPAQRELARVIDTLRDPGPFLTFSNGDPGVNNFLVDGDDGRIIDFESAGYAHALSDLSCLYVPGPMWMTISDPVDAGLEDAYREALSGSIPQVGDDALFGFGLSAACIAFAAMRFRRFPKLDARQTGDESRLQMITTLEIAAGVAESHRALPNLRDWMRRVAAALRTRWPDADTDVTAYAGYATRH